MKKRIGLMGIMGLMALSAFAQNPVSVRTTNGIAVNLTALGTTTADTITANSLVVSNSIILGAATNTPTFTWVQTNFIDGQVYNNQTGRMIEVRVFTRQNASGTSTAYEEVMINGTLTGIGQATGASGTGGYGFTNMISIMVSNNTSFAFTNQSTGGAFSGLLGGFSTGYMVY